MDEDIKAARARGEVAVRAKAMAIVLALLMPTQVLAQVQNRPIRMRWAATRDDRSPVAAPPGSTTRWVGRPEQSRAQVTGMLWLGQHRTRSGYVDSTEPIGSPLEGLSERRAIYGRLSRPAATDCEWKRGRETSSSGLHQKKF